jgi:putative ABC transport system substrate-binding protein
MSSRRQFITVIGGAAAWPVATRAQQPAMPVIGLLSGNAFDPKELAAIHKGLGETGYGEHRNVTIEYRSAEGHYDRLPALADALARRPVAVILAIGGTASAVAAKAATATVPIVFANGGDPVHVGLVASLNRPGGNITGVSFFVTTLGPKRLELLRELLPTVTTVGYLANPVNANVAAERTDIETAGRTLGLQVHVESTSDESGFEPAFAAFKPRGVGAVVIGSDAFFLSRRTQLAETAVRHALPAICDVREHALVGCVASYGTDRIDAYRQAGVYAGKVLRGEKPAELPVMQSVKFELVINLKTAKALGLTVPDMLLVRADEVIE